MELTFEKRKQALLKAVFRQCKHAQRRLEACREELELCRRWESLYHEGTLLQANLYRVKKGMKEIAVPDWLEEGKERVIHLDPLKPVHEQVQQIFKVSKKRKAAIPHLERQVEKREEHCRALQAAWELLNAVEEEGALKEWEAIHLPPPKAPSPKGKPIQAVPYNEYSSASGLPIRVGKGAKSNDQLTFRYSKGSDWWFHVRDYAGSHVVLVIAKGKDPDEEAVHDAMLMALMHSKAREEREAEITITQCKYVNRLGGSNPGKVQLSKHRTLTVKRDPERYKIIKERTIRPHH